MNRIIKSTAKVNIVTKCSNYTVDNGILRLGICNTTDDSAVLTLNCLTNNYIGCRGLCSILVIRNGKAVLLTKLNDVRGCIDSILIGREGSSVAVFVYCVNLHGGRGSCASDINNCIINNYNRLNCSVVKSFKNSNCKVNSLGCFTIGEANSSSLITNSQNFGSVNNILIARQNLAGIIIVYCYNLHTGRIECRACLIIDCIGINGNFNCLKNHRLKSNTYSSTDTLVSYLNITTPDIEVCGGADSKLSFFYSLAILLLALDVVSSNDKVLCLCIGKIVCKITNTFFERNCN